MKAKRATLPHELEKIISSCKSCDLSNESHPIHPRGNFSAKTMIVGEAPGKVEEQEDCFFIGPAGRLLEQELKEISLDLDQNFFIHNTVLCRPHPPAGTGKENRAPTSAEIKLCKSNFNVFLEAHDPRLIVLIGAIATRAIIPNFNQPISKVAGRFLQGENNRDLYVIWHPAYILRNMQKKNEWVTQLTRLRDYMIGRDLIYHE